MRLLPSGWNVGKLCRPYCTAQFKPELLRGVWQPVIGLEVHARVNSATKLFCRVSAKYGAPPNTQVGPFEAAHPGTLPVLNKRCVEAAIKTSLALQAEINKVSRFDRKHYFYPDLPAGYQITQKDHPIASNGIMNFNVTPKGSQKCYRHAARLTQLQLEEDSGKSIHDAEFNRTLVDLNRAGSPLIELVFAPDLRDGEEATALVKELILILRRIDTCSCQMEEGSLRVDANISVHRPGEPLGERTEVKGLASIRKMVKAVNFEIERQIDILEAGGSIVNETRRFDSFSNTTVKMRDKGTKHDYRFMPEPNLPPLRLYDSSEPNYTPNGSLDINHIREKMEELPEETRQRLVHDYGLSVQNAMELFNDDASVNYFLDVMSVGERNGQKVSNLMLNDLRNILNDIKLPIENSMLSTSDFGEIIDLLETGMIVHAISIKVMKAICYDGDKRTPSEIVLANNWTILSDAVLLEDYVVEIMTSNPKLVEKYRRRGKKKLFQSLMDILFAATEGRADMIKAKEIFTKKLNE